MTRTVRIDRVRLWNTLMGLKEIGAYDDEATGLRGVRRLALTDADAEARRLVASGQGQERPTRLDVVEPDVRSASLFPGVSGESPPVHQGGFALPCRPV